MAYKYSRGAFATSGSVTIEEGLTVTGSSTLGALTTTTISGTTAQYTILSASALGGAAVSGLTVNFVPTFNATAGTFVDSLIKSDPVNRNIALTASGGTVTLQVSGAVTTSGAITAGNGVTVSAGNLAVSAGTLSASNGIQGGGTSTLLDLTVNGNLTVLGNTFSASVGTLLIEDSAIVIGDGSTAFGTGYGLLFGSGSNQWASFQTAQANIDGVAGNENILSSSLSIKAPAFAGTFYGTLVPSLTEQPDTNITLANGINYVTGTISATRTYALPTSPTVGDSVKIKGGPGLSPSLQLIISGSGAHKIDGETTAVLESPYASIECVYLSTNNWGIF